MIIKRSAIEDLNEVAYLFDLYRVFYNQKSDVTSCTAFIRDRLLSKDSIIFTAYSEENKAAGFTQLYPSFTSVGMKKIWILNDLYVHKAYRRQGIAKQLLTHAVTFAEQTGRDKLILETGKDNIQAQKLYESLGWTKENNLIYQYTI